MHSNHRRALDPEHLQNGRCRFATKVWVSSTEDLLNVGV